MSDELTSSEILNLSKENFIKYIKDSEKIYFESLTKVENPDYENYSKEDKIKFWTENLHSLMRTQNESGLDPYSIFSPHWYNAMKRIEPIFDSIMEGVSVKFKLFNWEFNWDEFSKKISVE